MKIFKLLLMTFLLVKLPAHAIERPYIISGFDDVLRQAENTGFIKAALKILEKDKGFTGMPELYQVISNQEDAPQFTLVSAISNLFEGRIEKFLSNLQFPPNRRYLRNWLTEWSIKKFKLDKIREILKAKPNRKFIVIFDNSDASIQIAEQIKQQFPEQIVDIYLRMVASKNIPVHLHGFYTAFDIAVNEYQLGRLPYEDVIKVGQAILNENDKESIIPTYSLCPIQYNPCIPDSVKLAQICEKVSHHIQTLCKH
jgi:hypothetical protein